MALSDPFDAGRDAAAANTVMASSYDPPDTPSAQDADDAQRFPCIVVRGQKLDLESLARVPRAHSKSRVES